MDEYHVKIEAREQGDFIVTLTGPGIPLVDVEIVESIAQAKDWAQRRKAWHQAKPETVEYDL